MKKVLSLLLAAVLVVSALTGCGAKGDSEEKQTENGGDNPAAFSIGFPWATSSTDPTFVSIVNNVRAAVEAAGGELVLVESDLSAEDLINNVSDLISRDVDGIILMPASDSMLATVNQMCTEAEVYYGTMFRTINDDSIREEVYSSEYFTGGCFEDDEICAFNIVNNMVDQGVKNLCVINIAKGDTSSDLRDKGIEKAVEETGINLLNTTYGIASQTDMTKAIESYLAAYPELDGILLAGTYADAALPTIEKTLSDHKKSGDIIVGRIDFDFTMGEYFENGSFHVAYGGQQQIDPLLSTVILVNAVIGTPIVEGEPYNLVTNYLELTSAEEANDFLKYFLGDNAVYTADEIKERMIKFYNKDISKETFEGIVDEFSVQNVVERHEGMED
ncbi:sugar ABC transporter substrate-binding protein [Faecalicatena contorta]|uniref:ABC-type sugar transport system, substrate-binding protein, contains N-terminal xre family HTH domain n=1 Tax=Faecalicatena contorta TaxID=39482 RepID=A0A316A2H8_9FIRM|nr:substrate-binding domain-containing protein [Faecalicatena contorta]PWJ52061.1 ABC-type sugar transport system substrate-binding protein [Faecalicatena contorta]SUQ12339.1 ABC-type sugar transport system, substrate-binding protein, contains N-terminal xre family HTH domain [Faecalicatena contorta]